MSVLNHPSHVVFLQSLSILIRHSFKSLTRLLYSPEFPITLPSTRSQGLISPISRFILPCIRARQAQLPNNNLGQHRKGAARENCLPAGPWVEVRFIIPIHFIINLVSIHFPPPRRMGGGWKNKET